MSGPSTQLPQITTSNASTDPALTTTTSTTMPSLNLAKTTGLTPLSTPPSTPVKTIINSPQKVVFQTPDKLTILTPDPVTLRQAADNRNNQTRIDYETTIADKDKNITKLTNELNAAIATYEQIHNELIAANNEINTRGDKIDDLEREKIALTQANVPTTNTSVDLSQYMLCTDHDDTVNKMIAVMDDAEKNYKSIVDSFITPTKITRTSDIKKDIDNALLEYERFKRDYEQATKEIIKLQQTVSDRDKEISDLKENIKLSGDRNPPVTPIVQPNATAVIPTVLHTTGSPTDQMKAIVANTQAKRVQAANSAQVAKPNRVKTFNKSSTLREKTMLIRFELLTYPNDYPGITESSLDLDNIDDSGADRILEDTLKFTAK